MFDFDSSKPRTVSEMSNQFQSQTDDAGRSFIQNAKSKLQRIAQEKEQQFNSFSNSETNHTSNYLQSGMIILNEEDLKKKIIEIAKPIAKQVASEVIKEVLKEYAKKSNKSLVSEKKQDIQMLPSGKVIIAGKTFKLIADN
jgi:prophage antirepressor-like protein